MDQARAEQCARRLLFGTWGVLLLLVFATWRLWQPQNLFPRVPLFSIAGSWPAGMDNAVCGLFVLSLVLWPVIAMKPQLGRWVSALFLVSAALLVATDQHRLQTWIVHIGLIVLLRAACGTDSIQFLRAVRIFTIAIYIYSAISKFDAQFIHTVGRQFFEQILLFLRVSPQVISEADFPWAPLVFPLGELFAGVGLLFRRLRTIAAIAALFMHATLMLILGPLGLNHEWGVLLWNTLFIIHVYMLFLSPLATNCSTAVDVNSVTPSEPPVKHADSPKAKFSPLVLVITIFIVVFPAGERIGLVDHWLGWTLYAPHSSRVQVLIRNDMLETLPRHVWLHAVEMEKPLGWSELRMDRWSLADVHAPIYPQQRFEFGVARALIDPLPEGTWELRLLSAADHWTGEREVQTLRHRDELPKAAAKYRFNSRPVVP